MKLDTQAEEAPRARSAAGEAASTTKQKLDALVVDLNTQLSAALEDAAKSAADQSAFYAALARPLATAARNGTAGAALERCVSVLRAAEVALRADGRASGAEAVRAVADAMEETRGPELRMLTERDQAEDPLGTVRRGFSRACFFAASWAASFSFTCF